MEKRKASVFLAIALDLIFGLLFLLMMTQWKGENEEVTIHINQVGIFKEDENRDAFIRKLEEINLKAYSYQKEDLFIVVTSIHVDKEKCLKDQKILEKENISFVLKEVTSSSHEFVKAVKEENNEKIMELMSSEGKRN